MIINRLLIREVTLTAGAVGLIIVSIVTVVRLLGFLRDAAAGFIPLKSVLILLGLKLITYLDVILPLILFVAILMVLSRWNRDNEMTVVAACGIGLTNLWRPLTALFIVSALLEAMLSLFLSPLAVRVVEQLEHEYKHRTEISGIATGVFVETRRGRGVYFIESYDEAADVYRRVFVHSQSFGDEGVVVGDVAKLEVDAKTGDRFLVLSDGIRYEGSPGQPDFRIVDFESYAVRLKDEGTGRAIVPIKGWPTLELIAKNNNLVTNAELHWRLSKPLSLAVLILFAVGFSNIDTRRSRLPGVLGAFCVYFIYTSLLGFAVAMLRRGKIDPNFGLWIVHLVFLIVAVWFFWRRAQGKALIALPKLRTQGS